MYPPTTKRIAIRIIMAYEQGKQSLEDDVNPYSNNTYEKEGWAIGTDYRDGKTEQSIIRK